MESNLLFLQRITAMKRCRLKRYNFQIRNKMDKKNKTSDNKQNGNDFIADVSGSYPDDKPMTEVEYLEYMSKKAKTVYIMTYPDGSKGELNRGVVVLL